MFRVTATSLRASQFVGSTNKSNNLLRIPKTPFSSLSKPARPVIKINPKAGLTQNQRETIVALTTRSYQTPTRPASGVYEHGQEASRSLPYLLAALGAAGVVGLAAYGYLQSETAPGEGYIATRMRYTYTYLLGSLGITAGTVAMLARTRIPYKIATANPFLMFAVSIASLVGTQILTTSIPYDNVIPKHLAWASFCGALGALISPVAFAGGQLISQAAAATGVMVGSLSLVGASDPTGMFLNIGGPLSIGLGVLIGASLGSVFFPAVTALQSLVVYGGTALFGFFVLHDTQKMKVNARIQPRYDPINGCMSLVMDTVNIFMFMLNILSNRKQR